jgi:hypothetical protein
MIKDTNSFVLLITSLLVSFFIFSNCNSIDLKETGSNNKSNLSFNLDSIYGDKKIENETTIRENNFDNLIGLDKNLLLSNSSNYNVQKLDSNHFVIRQKNNYSDARTFNILLKTDSVKIVDFTVFNDFSISDIKLEDTNWIILLSDFDQNNKFWVSEQQIKIVKLDENLNEVWSYLNNQKIAFNGNSIVIKDDGYEFNIEIMTGCHICVINASILLSKEGDFLSVKKIGVQNSADISDSELQKLFN